MQKIKLFFFISLSLFLTKVYSQELKQLIPKSIKIEDVFSDDINEEASIHLIHYKEKKGTRKHGIIPVFFSKNDSIIKLNHLKFDKSMSFISGHQNSNETLTLIFKEKTKKEACDFHILDYNLQTGEKNLKIIHFSEFPEMIFKLPTKTVFIDVAMDKESFTYTKIATTSQIIETKLTPSENQISDFKKLFKSKINIIGTDEYIKFGSYISGKAFYDEDKIRLVHIEKDTGETTLIEIANNNPEIFTLKKIKSTDISKLKDANVFYYEDKLFYLFNHKKNVFLKVIDIPTEKVLLLSDFNKEFSQYFDEKDIKKYVSFTARKYYSPTITVNETVEGNMLVNMGYVDNRVYNYSHDWWFQQMMMNQMMQPPPINIPRFGPNPDQYMFIVADMEGVEPIQIVLSESFKILSDATKETKLKVINKDKYRNRFNGDLNIKHKSFVFLQNSVRTMFYSKKQKEFTISKSYY